MMLFTSFSHDETDEQLMERFAFRNNEKASKSFTAVMLPGLKVLYADAVGRRSVGG